MIKEAIAQLVKREDLTSEVMEQVMEEIMTGEATDAQKASFLTALSMKGETIDEITSAAKVLRSHCERFLNDMDVLEQVEMVLILSIYLHSHQLLYLPQEYLLQSMVTELLQVSVEQPIVLKHLV